MFEVLGCKVMVDILSISAEYSLEEAKLGDEACDF